MADSLLQTVALKYTPATATNTVENPIYYTFTAAPTQKISGYITTSTTPYTVDLGMFTTTMTVFVANLDTTNTLSVTVRPSGAGASTTFAVAVGGQLMLNAPLSVAQDLILTAGAATVQAFYYVAGT